MDDEYNGLKNFSFFLSYHKAMKRMSDDEALKFVRALSYYAFEDIEPDDLYGNAELAFIMAQPIIDESKKKSKAGKKGGSSKNSNDKSKQ